MALRKAHNETHTFQRPANSIDTSFTLCYFASTSLVPPPLNLHTMKKTKVGNICITLRSHYRKFVHKNNI